MTEQVVGSGVAARVTFVIPARNAAETIGATLDSVMRQSRPDWRIVIVNDRSTDETAAVIAQYLGDERIAVVEGPGEGASAARNRGANAAVTPWIVFLDADDLIADEYAAEMLVAAEQAGDEATFVYCSGRTLAADGTLGPVNRPPGADHARALKSYCLFMIHAVMLPAGLFRRSGGFDTSLEICEDWDLWVKLFRLGARTVEVNRPMALYRMRVGSLVRNPRLFMRCAEIVVDRARSALDDAPDTDRETDFIHLGFWALGMSIGAGAPDLSVLAGRRPREPLQYAKIEAFLQDGLATGACRHFDDWPKLRVKHGDAIRAQLAELSKSWAECDELEALSVALTGRGFDRALAVA